MAAADEFRQLDNSHVQLLRDFRCHQRNTWTKDVQRTIRVDVSDLVAGLLEDVDATAVGCYRLGAWVEAEEDDREFHICVVNV